MYCCQRERSGGAASSLLGLVMMMVLFGAVGTRAVRGLTRTKRVTLSLR